MIGKILQAVQKPARNATHSVVGGEEKVLRQNAKEIPVREITTPKIKKNIERNVSSFEKPKRRSGNSGTTDRLSPSNICRLWKNFP